MDSLLRAAALLPDLPRWVEARAYLLSGECEVYGLRLEPALSLVLRDPDLDLLVVAGAADAGDVRAAAATCGPGAELVCAPEDADGVARALPAWRRTRALLHTLPDPSRLPVPAPGRVRFVRGDEIGALRVPDGLRRELRTAAEDGPVAAALADGEPVSFCYAGSVTETLWDVSIDTVPEHRRKGYAGLCVAFMVRHMGERGRQPVWGAAEDNPPSWRLARKLGFVPVDELALFEAPASS